MSSNDSKKEQSVTIVFNENGKKYELPIVEGTLGAKAIDITNLLAETGTITVLLAPFTAQV